MIPQVPSCKKRRKNWAQRREKMGSDMGKTGVIPAKKRREKLGSSLLKEVGESWAHSGKKKRKENLGSSQQK